LIKIWIDPAPLPQKGGTEPNFRPVFVVAKGLDGSRWINIVFDKDPSSKWQSPPFWAHVCCGQMDGRIKMPLGTKVGFGLGRIVLHGDPAFPIRGTAPPNFRPVFIVAKRSPISATAEHLLTMATHYDTCFLCSSYVQYRMCRHYNVSDYKGRKDMSHC